MEVSKTYFPGLNGLRFFAAFAVLVTHVELTKKVLFHGDIYWLQIDKWIEGNAWSSIFREGPPAPVHWLSPFVTQGGYMGVIFFFVLSGFLITYLLLEEKRVSNTVAIGKFYVRRILRIWPLYYLIVILGLFVLPHLSLFDIKSQEIDLFKNFGINVFCHIFMLPNLAFALVMEGAPNIGQLWSIGVEEQFYLIWPVLMSMTRKPMRMIWIFLISVLGIKLIVYLLMHFVFPSPYIDPDLMISSPQETIKRFVGSLKFESMAIGALGAAYLFYKKEKMLRLIYSKPLQILAFLSIPAIVLFTPKALYGALYLLFSIPFLIIIMNVASNENSILKMRNKVFDFLGRISYGIYMYHLICITFTFHVLDHFIQFPLRLEGWHTLLLYVVSIPLTIGVSALSYHYFEKRFIQRKKKYTTVISGDDARES
jgi:peptidoglycan/LPS O-acetylase OafA/YrhL